MQNRTPSNIYDEKLAQFLSKHPENKYFSKKLRAEALNYKTNVFDKNKGLYLIREVCEDLAGVPKNDDGKRLKKRLKKDSDWYDFLIAGTCECLEITEKNIQEKTDAMVSAAMQGMQSSYGGVPSASLFRPQAILSLIIEKAASKLRLLKEDAPYKYYDNSML